MDNNIPYSDTKPIQPCLPLFATNQNHRRLLCVLFHFVAVFVVIFYLEFRFNYFIRNTNIKNTKSFY